MSLVTECDCQAGGSWPPAAPPLEEGKSVLNNVKLALYGLMISCYLVAGVIDLSQGNRKLGVMALMFGLVNALIFFWRE